MKNLTLFCCILTVAVFASCGKSDSGSGARVLSKELLVTAGQSSTIEITPNASGFYFSSKNDLIATVSDAGVVTGRIVGATEISVNNPAENIATRCKVIVVAAYAMYTEPCLTFNVTASGIKAYETRTLASEDADKLVYAGENANITSVSYVLTGSSYSSAVCAIPSEKSALLTSFLGERYVPVSDAGGLKVMSDPDKNVYIGISVQSPTHMQVVYMPTIPKASASEMTSEIGKVAAKFAGR